MPEPPWREPPGDARLKHLEKKFTGRALAGNGHFRRYRRHRRRRRAAAHARLGLHRDSGPRSGFIGVRRIVQEVPRGSWGAKATGITVEPQKWASRAGGTPENVVLRA